MCSCVSYNDDDDMMLLMPMTMMKIKNEPDVASDTAFSKANQRPEVLIGFASSTLVFPPPLHRNRLRYPPSVVSVLTMDRRQLPSQPGQEEELEPGQEGLQ